MSGIQVSARDVVVTHGTKLTTTAATAVYTVSGIIGAKAVAMKICNVDGIASDDVTVEWYDASLNTSFKLLSTYSLPQDTTLDIDLFGMALDDGDEIRVTESAVDDVHVVITVVETRR